jgi:hypothetical protein
MRRYSLQSLMQVVLLGALTAYCASFWFRYLRPYTYFALSDAISACWSFGFAALLTVGFASAAPQAGKVARHLSLAVIMLIGAYVSSPVLVVVSQPERSVAHFIQTIMLGALVAAVAWRCVMTIAAPSIPKIDRDLTHSG